MLDKCKYGISRIAYSTGVDLLDIYDGSVFQGKYKDECKNYLEGNLDYMPIYVMLNCDGFCPYKYRTYSSWCFVLTICNLPRALRNKKDFTILWSVVHPPQDGGFDGILEELVRNLESVYNGFFVNGLKFRVRLAMTCCDLPASRKLLGFTACNSTVACQFCKYKWPRQNSDDGPNRKGPPQPDFSGVEFLQHGNKSHEDLVHASALYRNCRTIGGREEISIENGFRDTPLLNLEYIDLMEIQTLDIMHLLGLGVVKKMILMICNPGMYTVDPQLLLSDSQKENLQKHLDYFNSRLPLDLYRLSPLFIFHLSNAKAAEFFTVLPVLPVLLALIGCEKKVVKLFQLLSDICAVCVAKTVDFQDIEVVKNDAFSFLSEYRDVFGVRNMTVSTHLLCHLHEQLKKFGPMSNFHLFFYERLNYLFSHTPTSNRLTSKEMEMTKRWFWNRHKPCAEADNFGSEIQFLLSQTYSLPDKITLDQIFESYKVSRGNEILPEGSRFDGDGKEFSLNKNERDCICHILGISDLNSGRILPSKYMRYKTFIYGGAKYSTAGERASHVGTVFDEGGNQTLRNYVAKIKYFMHVIIEDENYYFMHVEYFGPKSNSRNCWKDELGNDAVGLKCFNPAYTFATSNDSVIPIQRIFARYVFLEKNALLEIDRKLRR